MLRRFQTVALKNADAMFKAGVETKRGRLVQKDHETGKVVIPTSQDNLFWVDKDQYPIGLMSVEGELSDYDPRFEAIAVDEYVVLESPLYGERYGTTEYDSDGLTVGGYVEVDTTSGLLKASAGETRFKYVGTKNDNGHELAVIEIVQ